MPKHAVVSEHVSITDKLIGVRDTVRRKLNDKLGRRPWRVQIVTRKWSGGIIGRGTPITTILELDPRPLVKRNEGNRLSPGGQENQGDAEVTEISLRYTVSELQPPTDDATEVAWRMIDISGQQQADAWYLLDSDPINRRGDHPDDNKDWIVRLKQTSAMTDFDGGD